MSVSGDKWPKRKGGRSIVTFRQEVCEISEQIELVYPKTRPPSIYIYWATSARAWEMIG